MSDRIAEIARRIQTVRQLGTVINAMRGIAAQRAQQGRALLPGIRAFADTANRAIEQARLLVNAQGSLSSSTKSTAKTGLILFGAEQGFAGGFPELLIDEAARDMTHQHIFLLGARTVTIAKERNLPVNWSANLSNKADALTGLAMTVLDALYDYLDEAGPVPIDMAYPIWRSGQGASIRHIRLLPLELAPVPPLHAATAPLTNLAPADLIGDFTVEYVFARICEAAVEAFVAENEARIRTMAAARTHIDRKSDALRLEERLTRQDEITAEVVELAGGARSGRAKR
ncbi:F0F1 ATP synthase subunit gamma [Tardiphaga sp.]|uniref:F0F1 ATP synthase subunit gamma n=1 Tax=Tardiphaga sp. TaxID=1926292 RepID=UPI00352B65A4